MLYHTKGIIPTFQGAALPIRTGSSLDIFMIEQSSSPRLLTYIATGQIKTNVLKYKS